VAAGTRRSQQPLPGIEVRNDAPPEGVLVPDLLAAISFLTDAVLDHASRLHLDRYVAEDADDERLLAEFGTDVPVSRTGGWVRSRRAALGHREWDVMSWPMPAAGGASADRANLSGVALELE
jgi:hypothetical protein